MTITLILFFILAVTAVATALGLLLSRSAVYAALFLVLNLWDAQALKKALLGEKVGTLVTS
jgi:NADH:ubiquinone oxidoreductase subunit 6 (subunit J)